MNYTSLFHWGPSHTPKLISKLLILIATVAIFSALTNGLFTQFIGILSPQTVLSLSWFGIERFYLWEPVTYLFVQEQGFQGISFSFLFVLSLNLYFLWILGTSIYNRVDARHFIISYFLCGILSGLAALFMMTFTGHYSFLAGQTSALLGLFVIWTMLHIQSEIWLFFIVPIRTSWVLMGVIGILLLISLSQLDLVSFVRYFTGVLTGYLYGLFALDLPNPFPFLDRFQLNSAKMKKKHTESKIIDITGEPVLNDDLFVDEMLTKISKYGENSLTTAEKKRLDRISKSKMK